MLRQLFLRGRRSVPTHTGHIAVLLGNHSRRQGGGLRTPALTSVGGSSVRVSFINARRLACLGGHGSRIRTNVGQCAWARLIGITAHVRRIVLRIYCLVSMMSLASLRQLTTHPPLSATFCSWLVTISGWFRNLLCDLSPPQGIEQSASEAVVPEALKVLPHLTIRLPSLGEIAFYSRNIGRHLRHEVCQPTRSIF